MIVKIALFITSALVLLTSVSSLAMLGRRIVPGELTYPDSDESSFDRLKATFYSANSDYNLVETLGSFSGACEGKLEEFGQNPRLSFVKLLNNFVLDVQRVSIPNQYGPQYRSKITNKNHMIYPIALNASIQNGNSLSYQRSVRRTQKWVIEDPYIAATLFYFTRQEGSTFLGIWDFLGSKHNSISNPDIEIVELVKDSQNQYYARFFAKWTNQFQNQMPIEVTLYCGPLRFVPERELH